jgi:hypothetical protein
MMVPRSRLFAPAMAAACSFLMGLALLVLLCLGQPDVPAFANGNASISVERHGDVAALGRATGKAQALEIRASRSAAVKFANGNPALPASQAAFLVLGQSLSAEPIGAAEAISRPQASANRPRAPPAA